MAVFSLFSFLQFLSGIASHVSLFGFFAAALCAFLCYHIFQRAYPRRKVFWLVTFHLLFFVAGKVRIFTQAFLPPFPISVSDMMEPFQRYFVSLIERLFSEPSASLLAGLLLGEKSRLSQDLAEAFRDTGLFHILAISGYNVTLVASAIQGCFSWADRRIRTFAAIGCIVLFTLLVGAGPSAVRAAVMGSIGLVALSSGRATMPLWILSFAGFLMVLVTPALAQNDVGFLLSFAATLGLLLLAPLLKQRLPFIPEKFGVREIAASTLAAQIFTLPIILFYFHSFSLIAPVANLLILPFIPLIMIGGFFVLAVAVVSVTVAKLFAFVLTALMMFVILCVRLLASIPFASVAVSITPEALVGIYYWILLFRTLTPVRDSAPDLLESHTPVSSPRS